MWPCIPVTNVMFTAHSLLGSYIVHNEATPPRVFDGSIHVCHCSGIDRVQLRPIRLSQEICHTKGIWRYIPIGNFLSGLIVAK